MSKRKRLLIVFVVIIIIIIVNVLNPMRKDEENIRKDILKITPIGLDYSEVLELVKTTWNYDYTSNIGFRMGSADTMSGKTEFVGVKHIRGMIGIYGIVLETYVCAYWGFDENNKLVDVYVFKETDSL